MIDRNKQKEFQERVFILGVNIIKYYKRLSVEKREFILSKQLLRSGTSIGANLEEAFGSQSRKEFYAKISIAYRECRETIYWLKLLIHSEYLENDDSLQKLMIELQEIIRILGKTRVTLNKNINSIKEKKSNN